MVKKKQLIDFLNNRLANQKGVSSMDKPTGPCEICGGSGTVWNPSGYGYSVEKCTVCNHKPRDDNYYRDMVERLKREIREDCQ